MSAVQTYVPRRAFDALELPLIVHLAKLAGVDRPRVESSIHKIPSSIPAGSTRITCSLEMAFALVEAFKQQAMRAEGRDADLVISSALAVANLLAAIDEYHRPPGGSGSEPTPY
jgi:hypothetical protein